MRITGGEFRGRILKVPKSDAIRPTQDRVREAFFNMVAFELAGASFLDLFAGSGAVGIEALSRGARAATMVELNRRHLETLGENLSVVLGPRRSEATVVAADAYRWIETYSGPGFSFVFADPPYAEGRERGYSRMLETLADRGVVLPGGIFAAEMTSAQHADEVPGWTLYRDRTYGKTRICLWRLERKAQT